MSRKQAVLEINRGIPGSGKSYATEQKMKRNPGKYYRVNRDSFRFMFEGEGVFSNTPFVEDIISNLEQEAVTAFLEKGRNVIWDNTFIRPKYLQSALELVQKINKRGSVEVSVVINDFSDVPLKTCLERDANRANKVGEEIIKKMYKNLQQSNHEFWHLYSKFSAGKLVSDVEVEEYDDDLPDAYIFDIDGTLAHMNGRRSPFEWHRVGEDDLDKTVAKFAKMLADYSEHIIIMSGRDGVCRPETEQWLAKHNIKYDELFMRAENDSRKDNIVKQELYDNHIRGKYNVLVVFDDRDQVVKMWRSLGLKCFQVADGRF